MSRPTRYPSRFAPLVIIALLSAFVGGAVPAGIAGLFHGYAPHVDAPSATAKVVVRGIHAG